MIHYHIPPAQTESQPTNFKQCMLLLGKGLGLLLAFIMFLPMIALLLLPMLYLEATGTQHNSDEEY